MAKSHCVLKVLRFFYALEFFMLDGMTSVVEIDKQALLLPLKQRRMTKILIIISHTNASSSILTFDQ